MLLCSEHYLVNLGVRKQLMAILLDGISSSLLNDLEMKMTMFIFSIDKVIFYSILLI